MAVLIKQVAGVRDANECRDGIEEIYEKNRDDRWQQTELQGTEDVELEKDALEIRQTESLRRSAYQSERPRDARHTDDGGQKRKRVLSRHQESCNPTSENCQQRGLTQRAELY